MFLILLSIYQEIKLMSHMVNGNLLEKQPNFLPQRLHHFIVPPVITQEFQFPHILTMLVVFHFFDDSHRVSMKCYLIVIGFAFS